MNILLLLLLALFLFHFLPKFLKSGENGCPIHANEMCTLMAERNCQASETQAYMNTCADDGRCGVGQNAVTQACISSVRQKCLAGMGFAADPDRGMPSLLRNDAAWV